ncbi:MAG: Gfo/Idh/MocA family oxidoreductase, partial [Anaerobacillus sp.]
MQTVHVGLIGFGFSGATFHAPVIRAVEGLKLTKVVSSNPQKVYDACPEVIVEDSIEALLTDEAIELVIMTTPNEYHYPMALKALEAGKHVVLEKPFVVSVEEGEHLIQVAREKGCMLSVYHNRRYDNDFLTIQKLINEGDLGEIITFEAHYDRYRAEVRNRWREQNKKGSGILFDLGSHLIDQALTLFGVPDSLSADVIAQREEGRTDDYFHLVLH